MRAEMAAPYSVSALSTVQRCSCGENIFSRTQCDKFLEIIYFRSMPKVARARDQQRHATILAQCFGVPVALAAAWVHQAFHAGVNQQARTIIKWKERVACGGDNNGGCMRDRGLQFQVRFFNRVLA